MNRSAWNSLLGLVLLAGAPMAQADVRDTAGMFSPDVVERVNRDLATLRENHRWQVVIETVNSLNGGNPSKVASARASELRVHGLFIMISKADHHLEIRSHRDFSSVFTGQVRQDVKEKLLRSFRSGQFDSGLQSVAAYLKTIDSRPAKKASGPFTPSYVGHDDHGAGGGGLSMGTVLLIAGAGFIGLIMLSRMFAGAGSAGSAMGGAPGVGGNMAGAGAPGGYGGYGGYGGGGGWFRSILGGLGGAMLGNWLYDSFRGGGHAFGQDYTRDSGASSDNTGNDNPVSYDADQYDASGGDWGGNAPNDAAGDYDVGGYDGGGDIGGGDFGGDSNSGSW